MSSKVTAICMIVLLLAFTVSSAAGRPQPAASQLQYPNTAIKTQRLDTETDKVFEVDDDRCEGIEEQEEECLIRRTLAAHVDYIYTQNTKP